MPIVSATKLHQFYSAMQSIHVHGTLVASSLLVQSVG